MTTFINQRLGLMMIDSLWQGLIISMALAIILIFLRKSTVRYLLACIALTLMLILPIISNFDLPTLSMNQPLAVTTETSSLNNPVNPIPDNKPSQTTTPLNRPLSFSFVNTIYTSQQLELYLP